MIKHKPHRILAIKNRAIGDTVLMTGTLRILKAHYPHHEIYVLVRAPAGGLLEGLPYIDHIIAIKEPKSKWERFFYWAKLIRRLRSRRFDLVLNFHASFRSALSAKFLRAKKRIANHHELKGRNWFSEVPVPGRGKPKSIIDRDLDVLRAIGIQATVAQAMPEIILNAAEKQNAARLLPPKKGHRIFLGIGGSRETKRWPAEYFVTLARRIMKNFTADFVLATTHTDESWMESFWALVKEDPHLQKQIHHFHSLSLRQVAALISQCDIYIGNDSGLKHIAVALGLRTFTFFGPEVPLEWHPYDLSRHPYAFIENLACRTETGKHWCSIPVCVEHEHQCMKDIIPENVWNDIARILEESKTIL